MSKQLSSVIAAAAILATAASSEVIATDAPAVPKAPSKKSIALAIFQAKLTERSQGLFGSNKEFRTSVISTIQADLAVSLASASTMYNAAKKEAEAANAEVGLGRDPKKAKAPSTGKRGRPAGSKNKAKETTAPVVADAVAEGASAVEQAAEAVV